MCFGDWCKSEEGCKWLQVLQAFRLRKGLFDAVGSTRLGKLCPCSSDVSLSLSIILKHGYYEKTYLREKQCFVICTCITSITLYCGMFLVPGSWKSDRHMGSHVCSKNLWSGYWNGSLARNVGERCGFLEASWSNPHCRRGILQLPTMLAEACGSEGPNPKKTYWFCNEQRCSIVQ